MFTRTKHGANRLAEQLGKDGLRAAAIHGNKSQNQRVKALDDFKAGRVDILVATDVAARGIDIEQLPHVINYELPMVPEDYVHRIGRTGRAGTGGQAISLVCVDERPLLQDIQQLLRRAIPTETIAGFEPDRSIRPEPIRLRSTPAERAEIAARRAAAGGGRASGAWPAGCRASERGRGVWLQRAAPRLAGPARGRRVRRGTRTLRRRVRLARHAAARRHAAVLLRGRDPVLVARVAVDRPARPEPASATRPRRVADPPPSGPARTAVRRRVVLQTAVAPAVQATVVRPAAPAPVRATAVRPAVMPAADTQAADTARLDPSPGSASAARGSRPRKAGRHGIAAARRRPSGTSRPADAAWQSRSQDPTAGNVTGTTRWRRGTASSGRNRAGTCRTRTNLASATRKRDCGATCTAVPRRAVPGGGRRPAAGAGPRSRAGSAGPSRLPGGPRSASPRPRACRGARRASDVPPRRPHRGPGARRCPST